MKDSIISLLYHASLPAETGIACHNLGRKARMIEISAAYCSVILERFEQAFGITGVLVE